MLGKYVMVGEWCWSYSMIVAVTLKEGTRDRWRVWGQGIRGICFLLCDKHHNPKQVSGKKKGYFVLFPGQLLSLKEVRAGPEVETTEKCCLLAHPLAQAQLPSFYTTKAHLLRGGAAYRILDPSTSNINHDSFLQT